MMKMTRIYDEDETPEDKMGTDDAQRTLGSYRVWSWSLEMKVAI